MSLQGVQSDGVLSRSRSLRTSTRWMMSSATFIAALLLSVTSVLFLMAPSIQHPCCSASTTSPTSSPAARSSRFSGRRLDPGDLVWLTLVTRPLRLRGGFGRRAPARSRRSPRSGMSNRSAGASCAVAQSASRRSRRPASGELAADTAHAATRGCTEILGISATPPSRRHARRSLRVGCLGSSRLTLAMNLGARPLAWARTATGRADRRRHRGWVPFEPARPRVRNWRGFVLSVDHARLYSDAVIHTPSATCPWALWEDVVESRHTSQGQQVVAYGLIAVDVSGTEVRPRGDRGTSGSGVGGGRSAGRRTSRGGPTG